MRKTSSILIVSMLPALGLACAADGDADGDDGDSDSADDNADDSESGSDGEGDSGSSSGGEVEPVLPDVSGVTFVDVIDNPYLPMPVGATWVIESMTDEGLEHIEVEVLAEIRMIEGVAATVARDTVYLDGVVIEDTYDWFAQDADGNVWYLGEDTCEFEDGMCVDMVGAWEWGVDGALPGIVMPATPTVDGQPYYQEYLLGEAQDIGEVVELGLSISVPAGDFEDCIKIHESSAIDPSADEFKYYCPGVGNVLVEEGDVREELVEYEI